MLDGDSVEVYEQEWLAHKRMEKMPAIGQEAPVLIEFDYVVGGVILRLSKPVLPDQAAAYEAVLQELAACS